jgi:intraflagellar transport protein 140
VHETSVTFVRWSPDGTRLVSGDEDGRLCIWRVSKAGKATLVAETHRDASFARCAVADLADEFVFFVGTTENEVLLGDGDAHLTSAFKLDAALHSLIYDTQTASLVAVGNDLMVVQHRVGPGGALSSKYEFKLSGKTPGSFAWAGPGVLVATTGENQIRIWDSEEGETYSLSIARESGDFTPSDIIQTAAFDVRSSILAGGSRNGYVFLWKLTSSNADGSSKWTFLPPIDVGGSLVNVTFGPNSVLAAQNATDSVSILREHIMRKAYARDVAAVQVSSARLVVEVRGKTTHDLDTDMSIRGIAVDGEAVAVWSGKSVALYELVKEGAVLRNAGTFKCPATTCALHNGTVYTAEGAAIHARSFNGTSKQLLSLGSNEGEVLHLSANGDYLVAATSYGILRAWNLSQREARLHAVSGASSESSDGTLSLSLRAPSHLNRFSLKQP